MPGTDADTTALTLGRTRGRSRVPWSPVGGGHDVMRHSPPGSAGCDCLWRHAKDVDVEAVTALLDAQGPSFFVLRLVEIELPAVYCNAYDNVSKGPAVMSPVKAVSTLREVHLAGGSTDCDRREVGEGWRFRLPLSLLRVPLDLDPDLAGC